MKRLLFIIAFCITFLPLCAQSSGKEGLSFDYEAAFRYYFNNKEFSASDDALSGTVHTVSVTPLAGVRFCSSSTATHRLLGGIDFSHDMGAGSAWKEFGKEMVLFYDGTVTTEKGRFQGIAGAFPRNRMEGTYSRAFFTDEHIFTDRVLEGVLLKWTSAGGFYAELGADWMGKLGEERRERFQIITYARWKASRWLSLGWAGSFYHYAFSQLSPNVVDNHMANPWLKADAACFAPSWKELSMQAGLIVTYQRDRKQDDKTRFPAGCELILTASKSNLTLRNSTYFGGNLCPLFYKTDLSGIPYGHALYFGSEFYDKFYDMAEFFWEPRLSARVNLSLGVQAHFGRDGFLGWQQILSLKVAL